LIVVLEDSRGMKASRKSKVPTQYSQFHSPKEILNKDPDHAVT